jgi:membrane fusion protein, multidrug efflux system
MHRSSLLGVFAALGIALAAVLIGSAGVIAQPAPGKGAAAPGGGPPPPEVGVAKLTAEKVTVFEEYVGQTDAADTVEIRSRVMAILDRQVVADGEPVRKGQLLFVLDKEPFAATVAQVRAQLAQAEANHANSKQVLERIAPLAKEQAVSQQDLDAAIAKERSDAALADVIRAQLRSALLNLSYTEIIAPRDGLMSRAQVRPGGMVMQGTTLLATLYSNDPMYVNFTIPESRAFEFQKRLAAMNKLGGTLPLSVILPDGTPYKHAPRLSFVDPVVDSRSGTLQVRLSVPNPGRELRAGLYVRVKVPSYETDSAIRIPGRAVVELLGRRTVYIVQPDGKLETRDIRDARRTGQDWIIEKGFAAGEMVIVDGTGKIRPGITQVKIAAGKPPAGAPGAGAPKGPPLGKAGS